MGARSAIAQSRLRLKEDEARRSVEAVENARRRGSGRGNGDFRSRRSRRSPADGGERDGSAAAAIAAAGVMGGGGSAIAVMLRRRRDRISVSAGRHHGNAPQRQHQRKQQRNCSPKSWVRPHSGAKHTTEWGLLHANHARWGTLLMLSQSQTTGSRV